MYMVGFTKDLASSVSCKRTRRQLKTNLGMDASLDLTNKKMIIKFEKCVSSFPTLYNRWRKWKPTWNSRVKRLSFPSLLWPKLPPLSRTLLSFKFEARWEQSTTQFWKKGSRKNMINGFHRIIIEWEAHVNDWVPFYNIVSCD